MEDTSDMFVEQKNWGVSTQLLSTPFIEIYHINIQPKQYCSVHHHKFKYNAFVVPQGQLEIYKFIGKQTLIETATESKVVVVNPLVNHCFLNDMETEISAYEIYWPYAYTEKDDIVRKVIMHPTAYQFLLDKDRY